MRNPLLIAVLFGTLGCGCSTDHRLPFYKIPEVRDLPFIHKIDIQQGNVLTQDMLGQLRKGMDKKKVLFIMGSPIIQDTFNSARWDYVYTLKKGGGDVEGRRITLYFADEKLDHITGSVKAAEGEIEVTLHQDRTVDVPRQQNRGIVGRVAESIPFIGKKDEEQTAGKDQPKDGAKGAPDKGVAAQTGDKAGDKGATGAASVADANKAPTVDVPEDPNVEKATPAKRFNPYANIQAAPGEGVMVPPDAPREKKRFFGLFHGANDDAADIRRDDADASSTEGGRDARDISNPSR